MRKNQVDADSPSVNASSTKETVAKGGNTHGILNQHPTTSTSTASTTLPSSSSSSSSSSSPTRTPLFRIGVSIDRNKRWRRTMEDAHAFVYGYGGVQGQGFFSVFDGHAGKHAAEWCGKNFHQQLLESLSTNSTLPVPDVFAHAFHTVDEKLRISAEESNTSSGCTAVVAFLRLEDSEGNPMSGKGTGGVVCKVGQSNGSRGSIVSIGGVADGEQEGEEEGEKKPEEKRKSSFKDLIIGSSSSRPTSPSPKDKEKDRESGNAGNKEGIFSSFARRVRQASGHEKVNSVSNQNISTSSEKVDSTGGLPSSVSAPASTPDQSNNVQTINQENTNTKTPPTTTMINQDQAPSDSPSKINSNVITPSKANEQSTSTSESTSLSTDQSGDLSNSTSTNSETLKNEGEEEGDVSRSSILTATSTGTGGKDSLLDVYKNHENPENIRRVLYTANVGDARAVLCRSGKAVRLTYDHKGSDPQEAKRITDSGGFVMNNRVNGVLAVTRSLGDSAMKDFVVGSPYTTETTLGKEDSFLIVACDGLWDVADDQDAVDLILDVKDAQEASEKLLQHALSNFSTDNTSVMVIRLDH